MEGTAMLHRHSSLNRLVREQGKGSVTHLCPLLTCCQHAMHVLIYSL